MLDIFAARVEARCTEVSTAELDRLEIPAATPVLERLKDIARQRPILGERRTGITECRAYRFAAEKAALHEGDRESSGRCLIVPGDIPQSESVGLLKDPGP